MASKESGKNATYLNVEAIIEFEGLAEELDELEKVGKVPHVPDAMQHGWLCRVLNIAGVELLQGALAGWWHLSFVVMRVVFSW